MARADRFIKESDLDLALEILDATVELAPDDAEAWHRRATVHYLQKDYELALVDLRHALDIDPKHYNAINDLGAELQALGAKKEALQAYRKALEVNPFLEDARQAVESLSREVEGQDI
jgi:tetratricopeptide (TPR) repeat protein